MSTELSVILIAFNADDVQNALNNIYKQTLKNLEVFILTSNKVNISTKLEDNKYHIITINDISSVFKYALSIAASLPGNFITFMHSSDLNDANRFKSQIQFMITNNLNICSCNEMTIDHNPAQNQALAESNRFTDADSINSVISAAYLPLDLYTFMYKKSFLEDINLYSSDVVFESELDLIFFFLRFEKIYKVPQVLYYVKSPRIPYKECLYYYDSPNTKNKLALFNRSKVLEHQPYFRELINSKRLLIPKDKKYDSTIVAILDNVNIGGTETYIMSLANRLKKENIQLCVLTKKCIINELFLFYNIPLYILDIYNVNELSNTISSIDNISLIQIHASNELSLCPILKSIIDIPIFLTIHGIYYSEEIIRSYLKYITKIIFVSDYVSQYYLHLLKEQSYESYTTIINGIDITDDYINTLPEKIPLRKSLGIPEYSLIILYCSRLSFNKAAVALQFLKAFERVSKIYSNIYAVIIGDGNSAFAIKNAYPNSSNKNSNLIYPVNRNSTNTRIIFLGSRFNMLSYYFESDIVVGTGRVALEAMSTGTPVISFGSNLDVNIINKDNIDFLINSNFGDHFTKWEQPDESLIISKLNSCMEILINSKEKRTELGIWSKSYVSDNLNLDKISEFYKSICKNEK